MKRTHRLVTPIAAGIMCLHAGCTGGILTCQPDGNDPFQGTYRERASIMCEDGSQSAVGIAEIIFCQGRFSVTRDPFESFIDYWGDYVFDPATGELNMTITGGNNVSNDADLSGTVEFNADGSIVLRDIWFGSFDEGFGGGIGDPPPVICGHVLEPR